MKRIFVLALLLAIISLTGFSQNGWTRLTDYPGSGRNVMSGFKFQAQGFTGMGYSGSNTNSFIDFWAYNPSNQTWTQKVNFPGGLRYNNCSFSIGKYGFISLGSNGFTSYNDLWQYDESMNTWQQKSNFPGEARYGSVAYGYGNKGYVGLGEHDGPGGILDYFNDFYEYDQPSNTWSQKADFPGQARFTAFSFYVNNLFYVVAGRSEDQYYNWVYLKDMWAYNPLTNSWIQKASYPGQASWLTGFVINQMAYIGLGYDGTNNYNDFWRYNPVNDTWQQLPNFPSNARRTSFCFSVNNTGYLGCGGTGSTEFNDFWKYNDPAFASIENDEVVSINIKIYPTPVRDIIYIESDGINKVEIIDCNGKICKEISINAGSKINAINLIEFASGIYFLKVFTGKYSETKKIIVYR
jgi:N-acetylneuraminic acid mutarotase